MAQKYTKSNAKPDNGLQYGLQGSSARGSGVTTNAPQRARPLGRAERRSPVESCALVRTLAIRTETAYPLLPD
jgi:hypothetical protein